MTNREKIESMDDRELAKVLIYTEVSEEVIYHTPDGNRFDVEESAILYTMHWLNSKKWYSY